MSESRDEFPPRVKKTLAERVNYLCSKPDCHRLTSTASADPKKSTVMGRAAHITAASKNGPRYDPKLTREQRRSIDNGIWLCQEHADFIDKKENEDYYTVPEIKFWKQQTEEFVKKKPHILTDVGADVSFSNELMAEHLELLREDFGQELNEKIELINDKFQKGKIKQSFKEIHKIKNSPSKWAPLSKEVKCKFLRLEANLILLHSGNIQNAEKLLNEADKIGNKKDQLKLRIYINYFKHGPSKTLTEMIKYGKNKFIDLRLSFLLENNNYKESKKILESVPFTKLPEFDQYRLKAIIYLKTNDIENAIINIEKACEIHPDWLISKYLKAIILYYSAISIALRTNINTNWPEPIDQSLVNFDIVSLQNLEKAELIFKDLSNLSELSTVKRLDFKIWQLACKSNRPGFNKDATTYSLTLIENHPCDFRLLSWIIARTLNLDLTLSIKKLKTLVNKNRATIFQILGLVNCLLYLGKSRQAFNILTKTEEIFKNEKQYALWISWYCEALVKNSKTKEAKKVLEDKKESSDFTEIMSFILQEEAQKTNNWDNAIQFLEENYKSKKEPLFLFDLCKIKMSLADWSYVAKRSHELITEINTIEAFRIALFGLLNNGNYKKCLSIIEQNINNYQLHHYYTEILRIKVLCQEQLGIISEAERNIEELKHEDPSIQNIIISLKHNLNTGNYKKARIDALQISEHPDIKPEILLGVIDTILIVDKKLAIELFNELNINDIHDKVSIGHAYILANNLGLSDKLSKLHKIIEEAGGFERVGFVGKTFEDLKNLIMDGQKHYEKITKKYLHGEIPVHVIADKNRLIIFDLFHRQLTKNEEISTFLQKHISFTRHGGKTIPLGFPDEKPDWRLNLDITSILLAEHLEILDLVLKTFKTVQISKDVIPCLNEIKAELIPTQPNRFTNLKSILKLVDNNNIEIFTGDIPKNYYAANICQFYKIDFVFSLVHAKNVKGFLLDHLPKDIKDLDSLSKEILEGSETLLINCNALIKALLINGKINEEEYKEYKERLGNEGSEIKNQRIPDLKSTIICFVSTLDSIIEANLLELIIDNFRFQLVENQLDQINTDFKIKEENEKSYKWIDSLIKKINIGFKDRHIKIIEELSDDIQDNGFRDNNTYLSCLSSLFRFKKSERDVICIDDRFVNSFSRIDKGSVIGIIELLQVLKGLNKISEAKYYSILSKMRIQNIRFLSLSDDEIIHFLVKAQIVNEKIVETYELIIFRQYFNSCIFQDEIIQKPKDIPDETRNEFGELPFILLSNRSIENAIIKLWQDNSLSIEEKELKSSWIINSLYLDHITLINAKSGNTANENRHLVSMSLSSLLAKGFEVESKNVFEDRTIRKSYFQWLINKVLSKRFDADYLSQKTVVDILKRVFINTLENDPRIKSPVAMQLFYQDLPDTIKQEFMNDRQFMKKIGYELEDVIKIQNLTFKSHEFWNAAFKAYNGKECDIVEIETKDTIKFKSKKLNNGESVIYFINPINDNEIHYPKDEHVYLSDSISKREELLNTKYDLFDCPNEIRNKMITDIVLTKEPHNRAAKIQTIVRNNALIYYNEIGEKMRFRKDIKFPEFVPPCFKGILNHLRINTDIKQKIVRSEENVLKSFNPNDNSDLFFTIERYSSLPIPLPNFIIKELDKLDSNEFKLLVKQLIKTASSPISKVHIVSILLKRCTEENRYFRLARKTIYRMLSDDGLKEYQAFQSILNWISEEFITYKEFNELSIPHKFAIIWGHSHRLFSLFLNYGFLPQGIIENFSRQNIRLSSENLDRDRKFYSDSIHPHNLSFEIFIHDCLSYAISEEYKHLINELLREKLRNLFVSQIDTIRVPHLSLLKEPTRFKNSLKSFIGGDRTEKTKVFFEDHDTDLFSLASFNSIVESCMSNLHIDKRNSTPWIILSAIFGELEIYSKYKMLFKNIVKEINFVEFYENDYNLGEFSIIFTLNQLQYFSNKKLCKRIKEEFFEIIKLHRNLYVQKEESDNSGLEDSCNRLLSISVLVARSERKYYNFYYNISEIISMMIDLFPELIPFIRPVVERMYYSLSISETEHIWKLFVKVRSM
ncbi:hypothetical protein ACFL6G_04075 [candidate division KSB1 bacterium]